MRSVFKPRILRRFFLLMPSRLCLTMRPDGQDKACHTLLTGNHSISQLVHEHRFLVILGSPFRAKPSVPKAPKTFTLPAKCRLSGVGTFSRIMAARNSASDARLVVYAAANGLLITRIGISVGRKFGNAAQRNRMKRLIREVFRLNRVSVPIGFDLVIVPRACDHPILPDVQASLLSVAIRAISRVSRT